MATANVFSGARAIFKIDGNPIGYAGGVSGTESIDYEPVDVLDVLEVREFVPVAYRCTLNAQIFRVIGNSLKALSIFPSERNILNTPDLVCSITDHITEQTMASFQQCKCQEHAFDVTARGIVSENVTFVAIRVVDESEIPV